MSVRRYTKNRLTLTRECGTCGKTFTTTADTPWVRQIERDGKKQATTYFCSSKCFSASYKHIGWFDGKAEERRKEKESKRDIKEKNRRYYAAHADRERERALKRYYANKEAKTADQEFWNKKRKLLRGQEVRRITEVTEDGIRINGGKSYIENKEKPRAFRKNAIVRLAAYEDSGLTPEQVMELARRYKAEKSLA